MSDEHQSEQEPAVVGAAAGAGAGSSGWERSARQASIRVPEFAPLTAGGAAGAASSVSRFYDVDVTVWAEIGRVTIPLRDLLQLGEGSVVELKRQISAPVDLMAQGVRVATGEVVVVDDCFALRITEIENPDGNS